MARDTGTQRGNLLAQYAFDCMWLNEGNET